MIDYFIATATDMEQWGEQLARACQSISTGSIIYLTGELGTGKTTLVRGFLRACGHRGIVKSPTYTLVEPYQTATHRIYHFDLYRLTDPEELEYIGIRDYTGDNAICLIEWPDKGQDFVPAANLLLQLDYHQRGRLLTITACDQVGEHLLSVLVN